jgi:hypothetical protein
MPAALSYALSSPEFQRYSGAAVSPPRLARLYEVERYGNSPIP